jgi:hypothetical protein
VFFNEAITAGINYTVPECGANGITLNVFDASTGFGVNYPACDWEWILTVNGDVSASTDQNPTFHFDLIVRTGYSLFSDASNLMQWMYR